MKKLTIATRGSRLALWQANYIADCFSKKHGIATELLVLKTKGDIILDVPLAKVGGKGLFVKEIEEALLDGRADVAVHSMKDVPMQLPKGLILGVVPKREIAWDILLSVNYESLDALPVGAKIGTSSLRRQAQLLHKRPDCLVEFLRGNVETRIRKLTEGQYDAIIMAAAGLKRLELETPHMFLLTPPDFLPAVGQGALGIELNEDRSDLLGLFAFLNHQETYDCVSAERGFLAGLEGGCQVPIAGYATIDKHSEDQHMLTLEGFVADVTGTRNIRQTITGERKNARELGIALAMQIKKAGGDVILQELYATGDICQN